MKSLLASGVPQASKVSASITFVSPQLCYISWTLVGMLTLTHKTQLAQFIFMLGGLKLFQFSCLYIYFFLSPKQMVIDRKGFIQTNVSFSLCPYTNVGFCSETKRLENCGKALSSDTLWNMTVLTNAGRYCFFSSFWPGPNVIRQMRFHGDRERVS